MGYGSGMTAKLPPIRLGIRADEADMLALCHELHADNGLFDMEEEAVSKMLDRAYDSQGGMIGIIDGDNEIAAAIYMTITRIWYRSEEHIEELFSFVRPKYRKSNYALALVQFAMECSHASKRPLIIGILTNKRLEAKVRLYRQKLGMPAGAFFVYGIKTWANESVMDTKDLWRMHRGKRNGSAVIEAK